MIETIGQLKEAIKGLPDDSRLVCQVVATTGGAWNLELDFYPPNNMHWFSLIRLSHPKLTNLPATAFDYGKNKI